MSAFAKQIFSGYTNPSSIDVTRPFNQCDYLVFNPIGLGKDEVEIAVAVQIETIAEVEYGNNTIQSNVNLGKKELLLPIDYIDSSTIVPLPSEATAPQCNCRLCMSTSMAINLEIYAVYHPTCTCITELTKLLEDMEVINNLLTGVGINQIAQNTVLLGTANLLGAVFAPTTGGASLALPGVANQVLPAGNAAIFPVLTGAGVALPF